MKSIIGRNTIGILTKWVSIYKKSNPEPQIPTIKEYTKEQYPTLEHIHDDILDYDGNDIGHEEILIYDGKKYNVIIQHDGTYMEYGIKGMEVIFTEIKE